MRRVPALFLLLMILLVTGCSDEPLSTPDFNRAPETELHAAPPRALGEGRFEIEFFWSGSDVDGEVAAYEYRLVFPGRSTAGGGGVWIRTRDTHLRLELDADPEGTGFIGDRQSYLFQVRAIDDLGANDSSPAFSGFSSLSLAPRVEILLPVPPEADSCEPSPRSPRFSWKVEDADSKGTEGLQVRYTCLKIEELVSPGHPSPAPGSCLTREQMEEMNPFPWIPEDKWYEWKDVDAAHDAGRSVILPMLDYGDVILFIVQARDRTGTKSRVFTWEQDYRQLKIAPGYFPQLSMRDRLVGLRSAHGTNGLEHIDVLAGQPLVFEWSADASEYGGIIAAYRYGWDLVGVEDELDPGWMIPWTPGARVAAPRSFSTGTHNFVVQAIDNSGSITQLGYEFQVIEALPLENRRELLLIFDFGLGNSSIESRLLEKWTQEWDALLSGVLPLYDSAIDLMVASDAPGPLDLSKLMEYRSVIWFLNGANETTAFATLLRPQPGIWSYNWLEAYQAYGGNLLMTGPNAMLGSVDDNSYVMPMLYTSTDSPPDGLGVETLPNGERVPRGMLRLPYQGFCLSASDFCRPPGNSLYGESAGSERLRTLDCDYLSRAAVDPDFILAYPSAAGVLRDLTLEEGGPRQPDPLHGAPSGSGHYKIAWEEFYNINTTSKPGVVAPRRCQQVMFRWTAARDDVYPEGHSLAGQAIVDAEHDCYPNGSTSSALTGTATGVMSSVYSDTKPLNGSHDFVWGFHPLAFDPETVRGALAWVFAEDWDLTVQY